MTHGDNTEPDWLDDAGRSLALRLLALTAPDAPALDDATFEALTLEVFAWQRGRNPTLARIAEMTLGGGTPRGLDAIPAVPTEVYRHARVACFDPSRDVRVFATSGTTGELPGLHPFADLGLYSAGCVSAARRALLPLPRYRCAFAALSEREAPRSSLSFMLARFAEVWDPDATCPFVVHDQRIDTGALLAIVSEARSEGFPVALLGASWALVHALDAMDRECPLPEGSVVMPTGGFKGRSRDLDPSAFEAMLRARFAVPRSSIVGEYGMTELSSQAYEAAESLGRYRCPLWMRVSALDPERLLPVADGEVGLLRVIDLLNLGSAVAVQTSDLGRCHRDGFELLGRAPGATPRGCARSMDHLLAD